MTSNNERKSLMKPSDNPTETLAEFVASTRYEDVPASIIESGKKRILDTLGVTIAGVNEQVSLIVCNFVKELGGKPESTILGSPLRSTAHDAAFVNGTVAHAMDFDDAMLGSSLLGHPSVTILPAALAVSEPRAVSGKDFLLAYLTGVQVLGTIGSAVNPSHYDMGFHSTSTVGVLGAACAAGKILGLNKEEIIRALGISASMSSGLRSNFGTMTKPLHAGLAARNGVIAAILAKKGLTSTSNILEIENGYFDVMSEAVNCKVPDVGLGDFVYLLEITVKPYPSCAATHGIIDSVIKLSEMHLSEMNDISSITIEVSSLNAKVLKYNNPVTGLEGKFSGQYCAAIALIRHNVSVQDFGSLFVIDDNVKKIMSKIQLKTNDQLFSHGSMGAAVTIATFAGDKYSYVCKEPLGSPSNPMSNQRLEQKYRECLAGLLEEEQIERSMKSILNIEKLGDIRELTRLLVPRII